jgi:N-acetylglutamate synthase-like GNAT family acetyltransferase
MKREDISGIIDLQPNGWEELIPIFDFYTNSAFCFPLKAIIDNKIIGIGTTIIHDDIAWLAHIIVHPDYRNKGIGKLITQTLVDSLDMKKCQTIYLIATDLGTPVYKKLGFETETNYLFFKDLKNKSSWVPSDNISLYTDDLKVQIAKIDQKISGERRMFHLEAHLRNSYVFKKYNIVEGYYLPSFGEGLIIANTSSSGIELLKFHLLKNEKAAFPSDNLIASEFMDQNNYKAYKKVKRMRLGKKRTVLLSNIYNRIGGSLG